MSGGKSRASRSRAAGWEEAGGEFYQELYPGGEGDLFENLQKADTKRLATLLPSKQARNTTTVKRVRSQNERRQSTYARTTQSRDNHLSMLPDLSENLSNEQRTWEEMMQIKAMPVPMTQKRELKAQLQTENLSNEQRTWEEMMQIKAMPVPMTQKRELKAQLQNATKLRLQGLEQLQWRQRKVWHRFRIRFTEIMGKLELWQSPMREIEGKFGTGVVSYFLFLKWLLFLNLTISIFVIFFLILPKVLLVEEMLPCENYEYNSTNCCSDAYLNRNLSDSNVFLDIIQGTGIMERTILFYGVYSDQIYTYFLNNFLDKEMYYNMPLAFILVPIAWALLSLISIVKSGAKGFKERLIESEGQFYKYCNIVFGGWDFCIHNDKSAKIKHKALYNEIKGFLEEERYKEEKSLRSREGQIILFFKRLMVNLVVFIILFASGVFIYFVFQFSIEELDKQTNMTVIEPNYTLIRAERFTRFSVDPIGQLRITLLEFLPFLCIVILNIIVPEIFSYLIKLENYTPAHIIIITLLRTVLLRLSSLAVLIRQIYIRVKQDGGIECSYNNENVQIIECWETYVGQQLYKLVLTDFAVQIITTFFINLPRAFIARHTSNRCLKIIGEHDFYLPKHVLDIVYTQTIIWMGAFFCPFLPIIGTIFYFFIFYLKKFTCLVNCTPSPVVYKASKSKSLFMSVLLLGFIISIAPVAYSIAEITPSINCGPFRGLNTVWDFVTATFNTFPKVIRDAIFLIGTSNFAIPAFAILLFLLYYYWAVATANRHMVVVLKNQLVLEGHDKQFLLNRLSAFIRQHQKRCERRNRASFADDDSSVRQSSR